MAKSPSWIEMMQDVSWKYVFPCHHHNHLNDAPLACLMTGGVTGLFYNGSSLMIQ